MDKSDFGPKRSLLSTAKQADAKNQEGKQRKIKSTPLKPHRAEVTNGYIYY